MGIRRDALAPPLIEPIPLTEIFATGLAPVDHCGEYVRLTFFSDTIPNGAPPLVPDRFIVAQILMPAAVYYGSIKMIAGIPIVIG